MCASIAEEASLKENKGEKSENGLNIFRGFQLNNRRATRKL